GRGMARRAPHEPPTGYRARARDPALDAASVGVSRSVAGGAVPLVHELLVGEVAGEVGAEQLGEVHEQRVRRARRVRAEVEVRRVPEEVVGRQRLLARDVERSTGEVSRLERIDEGGFV